MTEDSRWSAERAEAVVVGRWGADVLVRLREPKSRWGEGVDASPLSRGVRRKSEQLNGKYIMND